MAEASGVAKRASSDRLRLLLIGLIVDGTDVGEAFVAYKWVEALSAVADVTLLCLQTPGRTPVQEQLPNARVITWPEPAILLRMERVRAIAKPAWPLFTYHVRRWVRDAQRRGERFDIAHQVVPQAMRNATPFLGLGLPYVMGPMGGSLSTPPSFAHEIESQSPFLKLRDLDSWRLRFDRRLRRTFQEAELVLGVAPYVGEYLARFLRMKRFEPIYQFAAEPCEVRPVHRRVPGELRLLHVGRGIRTKGLRDTIRALALLPHLPQVTLTSAGWGAEIDNCRAEAERLGVSDRVTFLGRVPREQVEELYATHDVFAFPSFREPMAGVFFEAMRWGLPVIGADRGGAQALLDPSFAIKVPVESPDQFARGIADAIEQLARDPERVRALGEGAQAKLQSIGGWPELAERMLTMYRSVLGAEIHGRQAA
jgi:glycosyltransferase involved in cell wall biosynthesis